MRVLVVGGGGREHALAWRLSSDPGVERVLAAPANPGIASVAERHEIAADDLRGIVGLVERERVDLTVVGPEGPLVAGLADALVSRGHLVFGPMRDGARLEGSKAWMKGLCREAGIPTARSQTVRTMEGALAALERFEAPFVVKADGPAAGKGVVITEDRSGAEAALRAALVDGAFGEAGTTVVIEQHLSGPEVSAFAVCDGERVVSLGLARDHKRIGDGDRGPNTGGMGAYSPVPDVDAATERAILTDLIEPAVGVMRAHGIDYRGVLFAGVMLTGDGPMLLEFNCRFGDPETQAILPRLGDGLADLLRAAAEGDLGERTPSFTGEACVNVVLAAAGYPGEPRGGDVIAGLEEAAEMPGVHVFHAGTREVSGRVVAAGGRVLSVSGLGATLAEARDRAYEGVARIGFEGMQVRTDIAGGIA